MFICQALLMFMSAPIILYGGQSAALLVLIATFIGFNYGANLALFPSRPLLSAITLFPPTW